MDKGRPGGGGEGVQGGGENGGGGGVLRAGKGGSERNCKPVQMQMHTVTSIKHLLF